MNAINTTIQGGKYKGQVLALPPHTITRAMAEKNRAAIFNTLGDLQGLAILDLFAGGGTLGFEALSRNALKSTFVDKSFKAINVLRKNTTRLGVEKQATVVQKAVEKFLASDSVGEYDVVFVDPPYTDFNISLVESLLHLVKLGGIVVLSCSSKTRFDTPAGVELIKDKIYGDTKITYLRKL